MRIARFVLPLALSISLVGCNGSAQKAPADDAMMQDGHSMSDGAIMNADAHVMVNDNQ